jgi:hypothetical protein
MKFLVFSIFLLSASVAANAQLVRNVCPELRVIGPAGLTSANERMRFVLELIGGGDTRNDLKYEWSIGNGEIIDGQGTLALEASSSIAGANVTATVTVKGLAAGCKKSASEISSVAPEIPWEVLDEYGKITPNRERGRLDCFFTELTINPDNKGYILTYETGEGQFSRWKRHFKMIIKHADFRKFDVTRLIFLGCEGEGPNTKFFRGPDGLQGRFDECRVIGLSEF